MSTSSNLVISNSGSQSSAAPVLPPIRLPSNGLEDNLSNDVLVIAGSVGTQTARLAKGAKYLAIETIRVIGDARDDFMDTLEDAPEAIRSAVSSAARKTSSAVLQALGTGAKVTVNAVSAGVSQAASATLEFVDENLTGPLADATTRRLYQGWAEDRAYRNIPHSTTQVPKMDHTANVISSDGTEEFLLLGPLPNPDAARPLLPTGLPAISEETEDASSETGSHFSDFLDLSEEKKTEG